MKFLGAAAWLLSAGMISAQIRPVSISALADGRIFGLDAAKKLCFIASNTGKIEMISINLDYPYQGFDLATGGSPMEPLIFVATRGAEMPFPPIIQYTAAGQEKRRWQIPVSFPSGLAYDTPRRLLYISTLQDVSIYRVDLNEPVGAKPRFLLQVSGAERLGAMAVDSSGSRLFAADPFSGTVYVISLASGVSSTLASNLGEPTALAVGTGSNLLYVLDQMRRCVWTIRLDQGLQKPVKFWSFPEFRQPAGLTMDASGTVWIGDKSTKALFGRDATGKVVKIPR
jgi:hypothetical protein